MRIPRVDSVDFLLSKRIGNDLIELTPRIDSVSILKPTGFFNSKFFNNSTVKYFNRIITNCLPRQSLLPSEKGRKETGSMRFAFDVLSMNRSVSNFLESKPFGCKGFSQFDGTGRLPIRCSFFFQCFSFSLK